MNKTTSFICTLFLLALIAFQGVFAQPASKFIVKSQAIDDVKNWYLPQVISQFQQFSIPDVSDESDLIHWQVTGINVHDFQIDVSQTGVTLNSGSMTVFTGGVSVAVDFQASCQVGVKVFGKWRKVASISGSGSASTNGATLSIPFTLNQDSNTGLLSVSFSDIGFSIGSFNVHLSGDLGVKILNQVLNLFNHQIKGTIENQVKNFLASALPTQLNQVLQKQKLYLDVPGTPFGINYAPSQAPVITPDHIELYSNSFFYLTPNSNTRPDIPLPGPIPADVDSEGLSFITMDYLFNSIGYVEYQANVLTYEVKSESISNPNTPLKLTVEGLSPLFPNLTNNFDKNLPIDIVVRPTAPPTLVTNQVMNISVEAAIDINVRLPTYNQTAFTILAALSSAVTPQVVQQDVLALQITVNDIVVGDLTLQNSIIGKVDLQRLLPILNAVLQAIKPQINNKLAEHTIPLTTIPGVSFSDVSIVLGDGYIKVLANPIFGESLATMISI